MLKYLLDTNIVIYTMKNRPQKVKKQFNRHAGQAQISTDSSRRKRYPCRVVEGEVAEDLFKRGLCLPSGTAMTNEDLDRIIEVIIRCRG